MKKALFFDGNSIMNRAFYGVKPLKTKDGLFTNAVFGYINIIKKHMDEIKPDFVASAFDLRAPTFRHKMYEQYKGTRKPMPDELVMQVEYVRNVTIGMGIKCLMKEGYEADDILGTLSRICTENDIFCTIVTGDRDALQLINEKCNVIIAATSGDIVYDEALFHEKYGFEPYHLIDLKALMGDSSDNIPGVVGIGEKTALKLVGEKGSIDKIYEELEDMGLSQTMGKKLKDGRESAYLSRDLATINLQIPDLPPLNDLKTKEYDINILRELFIKLEFSKLLHKFGIEEATQQSVSTQMSMMDITQEPVQKAEFFDIGADEFIMLCEDEIYGMISWDEKAFYLLSGNKVYRIKDDLKKIIVSDKFSIVVYNYKDYCRVCAEIYSVDIIPKIKNVVFDVLLAAYVINPTDSTTDISKTILVFAGESISSSNAKDIAFVCRYLPELSKTMREKILEIDCEELYYNIEFPLAKTLAKTECYGFKVSADGIKGYGEELKSEIVKTEEKIYNITGAFNINSPKQLGIILFEKLALPVLKKNKTGYSTDAETLERLSYRHPIIADILYYRQLTKLYSTYVEGLVKVIGEDGRIHTSFNQMLTATGRLSSAEPNLQNIPVRTALGRELRKYFIAENDDYLLVDADYSQIELRILAHISGDEKLIDAFNNNLDIHAITASEVFHVPLEEVTPEMRKSAKAVNFGIVYGIGDYSLSIDIGVPKAVAGEYIKGYLETYPRVKEYMDMTIKKAKEDGYVTTIFNRRRYITELSAAKKQMQSFGKRVAMNTPIQGSAADIIKLAMVNVDRIIEKENLKSRLIMQVHDELLIEVTKDEAEYVKKMLKEEMENAVQMDDVKLTCDIGVGKNWYDAH